MNLFVSDNLDTVIIVIRMKLSESFHKMLASLRIQNTGTLLVVVSGAYIVIILNTVGNVILVVLPSG